MSKPTKQEVILLTGNGWGIETTPDAIQIKENLLADAKLIVAVTDPETSATARAKMGELADIRIAVEKTRKKVKEPVLELGQKIDAAAKAYVVELTDEENRLQKLVGAYAAKIEAERQQAERERLAAEREKLRLELLEEQRIKAAEMEKTRLAEEAEKARIAAEEALFAGDDDSAEKAAEAEFAAAQEKARVEAAEAEQAAAAAESKAKADALACAIVAPRQAEGVKFDLDFEITDIAALYKAAPLLVELTPKRSLILAELKAQRDDGIKPGLAGLVVTQKAIVRR